MTKAANFLKGQVVLLALVVLVVIFSLASPSFLTGANIINILRQVAVYGLMACGLTFVLIGGNFDLSGGSLLSFTCVVMVYLHDKMGPVPAMLCAILVGVISGAVTGFFVGYLGLNSMITTLGMQTILQGSILLFTNGLYVKIEESLHVSNWFSFIGRGYILGIPTQIYIYVAAIVVCQIILSKTAFGRQLMAVGGNKTTSRYSGINDWLTVVKSYVICGICVALAGIVLASRGMAAQPTIGEGFEFEVLTACVLSGTSLLGGGGQRGQKLYWRAHYGSAAGGICHGGLPLLRPVADPVRHHHSGGLHRYPYQKEDGESMREKVVHFLRKYTVVPILIVLFTVFSMVSPKFLTLSNLTDVLLQSSLMGVMAVGATFLMINGYRDLSLGMVMGFSSNLVIGLQPYGMAVAIGCALLAGLVVGLLNGFLVAKVGINTFIVTLATMQGVRSLTYLYSRELSVLGQVEWFGDFGSSSVGGIPSLLLVFLVFLFLGQFVLTRTKYGRDVFACGSNSAAAYNAGINVVRTTMASFVVCSLTAAVSGIMLAARMNASLPTSGWPDTHFMVIVMIVLGGSKLSGGVGSMYFTLGGVLIIQMMQNFLNLMSVQTFYYQIITGILLISVLCMDKALAPKSLHRMSTAAKGKPGSASAENKATAL